MAAMFSRRFSYRLLTSSPSSSLLYTQSRPSNTIAKPTSLFQPSGTPKSLHLFHGSTPSCTESNTNSFSPSSGENPRNVWSSHTLNASQNHERLFVQKPKILDTSFVTSAPIVISRSPRPSSVTNARFFSANGSASKSENPELPHPSQIPDSSHPSFLANETRELLKKSMKKINGLKNALAAVSVVHIGLGAWAAYTFAFPQIVLIKMFLASATPLWLFIKLRHSLQRMHSIKIEMEEGLFLIFRKCCLVAWVMTAVCLLLSLVQVGLGYWTLDITRPPARAAPEVYVFPLLVFIQMLRQLLTISPQALDQLLAISPQKLGQLLHALTWTERNELLKMLNLYFVRLRRASHCAAGISAALILDSLLRNYIYQYLVNL